MNDPNIDGRFVKMAFSQVEEIFSLYKYGKCCSLFFIYTHTYDDMRT